MGGMINSSGARWYLDWRIAAGALLCATLVVAGLFWREAIISGQFLSLPIEHAAKILPTLHHPFLEFLKLLAAVLVGLLITSVYRVRPSDKASGLSMQQAQVLLCVAGALMMIIIGDSLARAFGIAGGASIVRFRTPVEDPKDTMILFLLLGLGMACGVGAFALAGLGTAFLCIVLLWLQRAVERRPRGMILALSAEGGELPVAHVQDVLARHKVEFQAHEASHGKRSEIRYRVWIPPETSLDHLNDELKARDGVVLKSVTFERLRKRDL